MPVLSFGQGRGSKRRIRKNRGLDTASILGSIRIFALAIPCLRTLPNAHNRLLYYWQSYREQNYHQCCIYKDPILDITLQPEVMQDAERHRKVYQAMQYFPPPAQSFLPAICGCER